jgi:hypothetical protein
MTNPFARLTLVASAVFVPGLACSLLLQEQSLPCHLDADCAPYNGSHCDLQQNRCVQGSPIDASGSAPGRDAEAGPAPDAAIDSSAVSSTMDSAVDAAPDAPQDAGDADAGPTQPNWIAAQGYLDGLFDPTQSLLKRAPGSTQFWTMNDNALAAKAFLYLPMPETTRLAAIQARLQNLVVCGCLDVSGHATSMNHFIDPVVNKGAQIPLTPATACFEVPLDTTSGATCSRDAGADASVPSCPATQVLHEDHPQNGLSADACNAGTCTAGTFGTWNASGTGMGYADIVVYEILNYRNRMASPAAINGLWQLLLGKWDGVGLKDAAVAADGQYSTYKLALFKLAARAIGESLPTGVEETIVASQGTNGGFRSSYNSLGIWTDDASDAPTTALVVLAYRMPMTDY